MSSFSSTTTLPIPKTAHVNGTQPNLPTEREEANDIAATKRFRESATNFFEHPARNSYHLPEAGIEPEPERADQPRKSSLRSRPWVDQDYYRANPWYNQPKTRPIFSLGRPLPRVVRHGRKRHGTRRRRLDPVDVASRLEAGGIGPRLDGDVPQLPAIRLDNSRPLQFSNSRNYIVSELLQRRAAETAAGATSGNRKNAAGQPVFDYYPHYSGSLKQEDEAHGDEKRDESRHFGGSEDDEQGSRRREPEFKIDGEPLGHRDDAAVEEEGQDPEELRNWWARLRAKHPEPLAEFLATFLAVFLGLSGSLAVNLSKDHSMTYGNYETSCWAWGFSWMFGIYVGGGVSGAHMNPAVSVCLSIFRGFPWKQCVVYSAAQLLASLAAGAVAYSIYSDSISSMDRNNEDLGRTFFSTPQPWVSMGTAVWCQIAASSTMMVAVLALGDDQNNPPGAGMHAFVLGLLVTTLKFTMGYNIGTALNPASDIGPRVVAYILGCTEAETFRSGWWFYGPWAGTLLGSVIGCVIYDGCVFVGTESPVNWKFSTRIRDNRIRRAIKSV